MNQGRLTLLESLLQPFYHLVVLSGVSIQPRNAHRGNVDMLGTRDGEYTVCLTSKAEWGGPNDCSDSFTIKVPQAVVIWPAGKLLGSYKAIWNIVKGTGRFKFASGQLEVPGTFILWNDANSRFGVSGRWNGEFSGRICGVL
jgi:hypothetical protein